MHNQIQQKTKTGFESHEAVIVRLVNALGQAVLLDALSHYDVSTDIISVGDQSYRRKHKANKTYQTAFGAVEIERHVYTNRKTDGDGKCIVPLELQAGIAEGYWTPIAAKKCSLGISTFNTAGSGRHVITAGCYEPIMQQSFKQQG